MSETPPPEEPQPPVSTPPGTVPLAIPEALPHPVRLIVGDDLKRSRLTVFFRLLLLIPHFALVDVWSYGLAIPVLVIINWFAVLIKGRSPEDLHLLLVRALRYRTHVSSYLLPRLEPVSDVLRPPGQPSRRPGGRRP